MPHKGSWPHTKGEHLGSMGDYGCFSFHETKNYTMGEGGAILVNRTEDMRGGGNHQRKGHGP